jgi:type IV protein arginine methyltransferase
MADQDSISARISPNCPPETQRLLTAAWAHDALTVRKLIDEPGKASCQDPQTGETPLHAAIRACGPPSKDDTPEDLEAARKTVYELFLWGAIWNDVDDHNETPGCVAYRLKRPELYGLCVDAGTRAELLFGVLDGYEELGSEGEYEDEEMELELENGDAAVGEDGDEAPQLVSVEENGQNGTAECVEVAEEVEKEEQSFQPPKPEGPDVKSEIYLRSKLTYTDGKLVDDAGNGVMMAWETEIMRQSVDALLPDKEPGRRVLNIGFGMGIIDTMFAETKLSKHHIIEAHLEVLEHISSPESKFSASWESAGPEPGAFKVYHGKWQEVCLQLLEEGQVYDAIYFDTFGEDYSQLRKFFTEFIPGLLDSDGRFGFFNGLGADRQICYDVYTKVSEMHLADAGLDVEWKDVDVDMEALAEAGKGEWEGVKRRYWTLDSEYDGFSLLDHF